MPRKDSVWLLTYGAACPKLTETICAECGIPLNECYTLEERDFKYTLVRTKKGCTLSEVEDMMQRAESAHGIKPNNIFGYEAIASSSDIDEHPGYNLIRKGMYEGKRIHYWLARGSIRTNRKGLLFRYVSKRSTSQMTKHQLQNLIAAMKRERQESRKVLQIYREAFDEIRASIKRSNDRQAAAQP